MLQKPPHKTAWHSTQISNCTVYFIKQWAVECTNSAKTLIILPFQITFSNNITSPYMSHLHCCIMGQKCVNTTFRIFVCNLSNSRLHAHIFYTTHKTVKTVLSHCLPWLIHFPSRPVPKSTSCLWLYFLSECAASDGEADVTVIMVITVMHITQTTQTLKWQFKLLTWCI